MKQHEKILKSFVIQKYTLISFLLAFLVFNIIFSQFFPSSYFKFANNDRKTTVNFLQKITGLPEYQNILKMNYGIYGSTLKTEIFAEESKKKAMINNLEQQLTINPKARDILYSLYKLYLAEGDKKQANIYLMRAREVDPSIKN
jgi:tetratricopeptide (TPR) repeat protein